MSLPARERRRLSGIQCALDRSDPRLASLFATFSRLTQEEEMPHFERLRVRADRFAARGKYLKLAVPRRIPRTAGPRPARARLCACPEPGTRR